MKRNLFFAAIVFSFALSVAGQNAEKKWTEWSKKDADKILTSSPWAKIQTDADLAEMFYRPNAPSIGDGNRQRDGSRAINTDPQGPINQATFIKLNIRFLSARPIRQALARTIILQATQSDENMKRLTAFAETEESNYIYVTVSFESKDQRLLNPVMQLFGSRTTETLRNDTYLERKDGKRIFLQAYLAPGADGLGAKFAFPRTVEGQPFLNSDSGEVRFYSIIAKRENIEVNMRFKIKDMMYQGKLEY